VDAQSLRWAYSVPRGMATRPLMVAGEILHSYINSEGSKFREDKRREGMYTDACVVRFVWWIHLCKMKC
jgi:hypothetical protein